MLRKFRSSFSLALIVALVLGLSAPTRARAAESVLAPTPSYDLLQQKARTIEDRNVTAGWGYIISGGLALGISIPGYFLSEDVFARAVYSLGQTLGVAAVGYGSYLVLVDDDYIRFKRVIDGVPNLSRDSKNRLAQGFLDENADRARNVRRIRAITHGLTAGLNFLNAFTTSNSELKTALLFLGGINTLAAVSFSLTKSEEEKVAGSSNSRAKAELLIGRQVGVRVSF